MFDMESVKALAASVEEMTRTVGEQNRILTAAIMRNADLLDSYLVEGGIAPGGQTSPWTIPAQTNDVELVTGIYIQGSASNGITADTLSLQMDDFVLTATNQNQVTGPMALPVKKRDRIVRWSGAYTGGNVLPFALPLVCIIFARPAPVSPFGVLH